MEKKVQPAVMILDCLPTHWSPNKYTHRSEHSYLGTRSDLTSATVPTDIPPQHTPLTDHLGQAKALIDSGYLEGSFKKINLKS